MPTLISYLSIGKSVGTEYRTHTCSTVCTQSIIIFIVVVVVVVVVGLVRKEGNITSFVCLSCKISDLNNITNNNPLAHQTHLPTTHYPRRSAAAAAFSDCIYMCMPAS